MVPAEGIEPPTFGLQNRCSTAELSRLTKQLQSLIKSNLLTVTIGVHIGVHLKPRVAALYHAPHLGAKAPLLRPARNKQSSAPRRTGPAPLRDVAAGRLVRRGDGVQETRSRG